MIPTPPAPRRETPDLEAIDGHLTLDAGNPAAYPLVLAQLKDDIRVLLAEVRRLRAERETLISDVRTILAAFSDRVFIRNTDGDARHDWAMKCILPVAALARLQQAAPLPQPTPTEET